MIINPFRRARNWLGETKKQEWERRVSALEDSRLEIEKELIWLKYRLGRVEPPPPAPTPEES